MLPAYKGRSCRCKGSWCPTRWSERWLAPLVKYIRENGTGKALGGIQRAANDRAEVWRSVVGAMVADGLSNPAIAEALNATGEKSVRGGVWTSRGVGRVRARLAA